MMKPLKTYRHIFFDLDHTLWDFETNSQSVLSLLFSEYHLKEHFGVSEKQFISKYSEINADMWNRFHRNEISRDELRVSRFGKTFRYFGIHSPALEKIFPEQYLELLPQQNQLFPDAYRVLDYLKTKYKLHLITNGFEKVQRSKLFHSCLEPYFDVLVISELTGYKKPEPEIFEYALHHAKAIKEESVMIGDDLTADIEGALNFGMDAVFFNPAERPFENQNALQIKELKELMYLL